MPGYKRNKPVLSGSLSRSAWRRFRRNIPAMAGLIWIILSAFLALLGYLITPDTSPFANQQHLEMATRKPGFSINMLLIRHNTTEKRQSFLKTMLYGRPPQYSQVPIQNHGFRHDRLVYETYAGEAGYPGMLRDVSLADIIYPLSTAHDPALISPDSLQFRLVDGTVSTLMVHALQQQVKDNHIVRKRFLLGTDRFGRDMLSQLIIGMRVSLSVGFIAVFISLLIGITLGSLGGYFRGRVDDVIVWLINVVWSIPTLLLVIAITFAIGKGFWQVFLAVGLTMWVEVARVVRGQMLSMREKEFVEAARALGLTHQRIILRHILPNIMGPVIVISAANFASAILIEAGLSFLGIGVQPPMPSWGTMIRDHYGFIILDKAFLVFLPGLLIMLTVLAFMLVGNGLKEALDRTANA